MCINLLNNGIFEANKLFAHESAASAAAFAAATATVHVSITYISYINLFACILTYRYIYTGIYILFTFLSSPDQLISMWWFVVLASLNENTKFRTNKRTRKCGKKIICPAQG